MRVLLMKATWLFKAHFPAQVLTQMSHSQERQAILNWLVETNIMHHYEVDERPTSPALHIAVSCHDYLCYLVIPREADQLLFKMKTDYF